MVGGGHLDFHRLGAGLAGNEGTLSSLNSD